MDPNLTTQDPWVDIAALENETAQILQFVSPQKNGGRNQKRDGRSSQDTNASKRGADSKKRPKADDSATPTKRPLKKGRGVGGGAGDTPNRVTALMSLSQSTDSGLDRTKSLYNAGGGNSATTTPIRSAMGSSGSSRVTVEVLDDAGQDATPRDDIELKREKLRDQLLAAEAEQVRLMQASESGYRTSQFPQEKTRVARRDDTFVPAPTVRIGDVNREKSRLDRLEESARAKARTFRNEAESRREFLQQDLAATKIQSLFRSAIGRQKFDLVKRLKELDETGLDWIEVRDRESGDTWFYNKRTGVSQWEKPDELDGQLSKTGNVKRLPPFSSVADRLAAAAKRGGSSGGMGVLTPGETLGYNHHPIHSHSATSSPHHRIHTAPANAQRLGGGGDRSFTAATTLPSLDSLHRAKTAATNEKAMSMAMRKVSFNTTMEVNTGSQKIAVEMPDLNQFRDGTRGRVQTPAKGERDIIRSPASSSVSSRAATPGGSPFVATGTGGLGGHLNSNNMTYGSTSSSTDTQVMSWEEIERDEREKAARREVEKVMGLNRMMPPANLLDPTGSFKPQLRTTVHDALLSTRFDSVSSVLSDASWLDNDADPFKKLSNSGMKSSLTMGFSTGVGMDGSGLTPSKLEKIDASRRPMVSVFNLKKKGLGALTSPMGSRGNNNNVHRIDLDHRADGGLLSPIATPSKSLRKSLGASSSGNGTPSSAMEGAASSLSIREVDHRDGGTEAINKPGTAEYERGMSMMGVEDEMCFGCWSAGGQRKCQLHEAPYSKRPSSETMLLCRNWDLDVMKRRYRSEELQELFERKKPSLRFVSKAKKFISVVEQKHQIYRCVAYAIERCQFRFVTFLKSKRWLFSFADELRMGRVRPRATKSLAKKIRDRRTLKSHTEVRNYFKKIFASLPMAPITGFSWPERTGDEQYLFRHPDPVLETEVEIIFAEPVSVPNFLYRPRKYTLPLPVSIPMPTPEYSVHSETGQSHDIFNAARLIDVNSPAAWLERVCSAYAMGCIKAAQIQVRAATPAKGSELLRRSKDPPPSGVKFATLGRKPAPGNLAVGGLPMELLIYQLITTFVPSQYGNMMSTDKQPISPGVSPETAIKFDSCPMPPGVQAFVLRVVEHPLNYRHAPTIIISSHIQPSDKAYFGHNRPEQTGEEEAHGFRTSAWSVSLLPGDAVIPFSFTPGLEVATLNTAKANVACTTHADGTYPFCTPSTRDTTTLDFYHLLLNVQFSGPKAQIFTVLTTQECGKFMAKYDTSQGLGPMVAAVYRSWAFTQKDTIQEFKTDDGIPYWYHRVTGQTFWERPLYEDEIEHPLKGGTVLDSKHDEEPSMMKRGEEGTVRRMNQGTFRNLQGNHHESDIEAVKRRKRVAALAPVARDKNQIPGITPLALNAQADMYGFNPVDLAKDSNNNDNNNDNSSHHTGGGSAIDTLSAFTVDSRAPNPRRLTEIDVSTPSTGILKFPRPQGGTVLEDANNRPGSPMLTTKKPVVNGTLADFDPDGKPTTWNGERIVRGNVEAGYMSPPQSPVHSPSAKDRRLTVGFSSRKSSGGGGGGESGFSSPNSRSSSPTQFDFSPNNGGGAGQGAMDSRMVSTISQSLGAAISNLHLGEGKATAEEMIQIGLGLGMALMQSGAFGNNNNNSNNNNSKQGEAKLVKRKASSPSSAAAASAEVEGASMFPVLSEDAYQEAYEKNVVGAEPPKRPDFAAGMTGAAAAARVEPINQSRATVAFDPDNGIVHKAEQEQQQKSLSEYDRRSTSMEEAFGETVQQLPMTDRPDFDALGGKKALKKGLPMNADEGAREKVPVLIYPELSSVGSQLEGYSTHPTAGLGDTFGPGVNPQVEGLNFMALPLPQSFFEAIVTTHIAKQEVDYLPQALNLPQPRNVGRVRPRSAALDWIAISFDPWSAGKSPLNTEFAPSLAAKEHEFQGKDSKGKPTTHTADGSAPVKGGEKKEIRESIQSMQQRITKDAFINVDDDVGLQKIEASISLDQLMENEFKALSSLCRHGKFADAEDMLNQPDWRLPVDYQDYMGNTILHVMAQNGNKRLVKLALKRGATIDLQNIYGNTVLHFAFGMGYNELGEYLISKGANETIKNAEGLTCYEGLNGRELGLL